MAQQRCHRKLASVIRNSVLHKKRKSKNKTEEIVRIIYCSVCQFFILVSGEWKMEFPRNKL